MISDFGQKLNMALGPTKAEAEAVRISFDAHWPWLVKWLRMKAAGYVEVSPGILRKPELSTGGRQFSAGGRQFSA